MAGQKASTLWAGFSFVSYWKVDTFRYIKFHLSDHVWNWFRSVWRISWSVLEEILRYIILSSAKRRIEDLMFPSMSFM